MPTFGKVPVTEVSNHAATRQGLDDFGLEHPDPSVEPLIRIVIDRLAARL